MANYANIKSTINAYIKQNGNQEITGAILNGVLNGMVSALGAGYKYGGIVTTATEPGSPESNLFYFATEPGTYTHLGGLTLASGKVAIITWDGTWRKAELGIPSNYKINDIDEALGEMSEVILALQEQYGDIYTKAEMNAIVNGKANDADVVHKAGAETITGKKTLSGGASLSGSKLESVGAPTANADGANKKYVDDADTALAGRIGAVEGKTAHIDEDAGQIFMTAETFFSSAIDVTGDISSQGNLQVSGNLSGADLSVGAVMMSGGNITFYEAGTEIKVRDNITEESVSYDMEINADSVTINGTNIETLAQHDVVSQTLTSASDKAKVRANAGIVVVTEMPESPTDGIVYLVVEE